MARSRSASPAPVAAAVGLTFFLWYAVFVWRPGNFFVLMALNTALLAFLAWKLQRPLLVRSDLRLRNLLAGLGAALLLYAVFWAGNAGLKLLGRWFQLMTDRPERLEAIYQSGGSLSPGLTALLLVFPIGFGEELFWRGLVQRRLGERLGRWPGLLVATGLYAAVHLSSGNPLLILAALACGLFWGGLYALTGSLTLVLAAHMAWDPLIFVLFPIR